MSQDEDFEDQGPPERHFFTVKFENSDFDSLGGEHASVRSSRIILWAWINSLAASPYKYRLALNQVVVCPNELEKRCGLSKRVIESGLEVFARRRRVLLEKLGRDSTHLELSRGRGTKYLVTILSPNEQEVAFHSDAMAGRVEWYGKEPGYVPSSLEKSDVVVTEIDDPRSRFRVSGTGASQLTLVVEPGT